MSPSRRRATFLREPRHAIAGLRVFVLAGLAMLGLGMEPEHHFLYWFLTITYGVTIFGYLWARNRDYGLQRVKWLVFLFDVGMVSALILMRGDRVPSFIAAYFTIVLIAAIVDGLGNALLNALLVSVIYAAVTNWGAPSEELLAFSTISQFVFFFVIAIFMAHLAREARAEAYGKAAAQEALRVTSGELQQSTEQLRQARDSLRASDRLATLGMLSAGITHELKNPLAAIVNSLEPADDILEELDEDVRGGGSGAEAMEELRSIFEDCQIACAQLMRVTRDLSSVAKPRPEAVAAVRPAILIDSTLRMLTNRTSSTMQIETRVETERRIVADPGRLLQVLLNLAGNGLDAMSAQGEGTLRIIAEDAGVMRVAFRVEDTGPGIPAGVLDSMFEPFFTTKPPGEGTGLGLHVVNEIVKSLRGTIQCETARGEGTQFRVELPALVEAGTTETHHGGKHEEAADRGRRAHDPQGASAHVSAGAV